MLCYNNMLLRNALRLFYVYLICFKISSGCVPISLVIASLSTMILTPKLCRFFVNAKCLFNGKATFGCKVTTKINFHSK